MALKIGIIGTGGMSHYHINGFRKGGAEVTAIFSRTEPKAIKMSNEYDIPNYYSDIDEMLKSDIDAVSIIVPNKFHAPLTIKALDLGKHVFCEKPPSLNSQEMEEMIKFRDKSGKTLMFNFNNRARPESIKIMKLIEEGVIGKINSAQAKWCRRTGIPGFGGWFTTKSLSGGGPVIDLLHMLDLAMYFMRNPKPSFVLAKNFDDHINNKNFKGPWGIPDVEDGVTDVESASHGFVTFDTGQSINFQMSWAEMVKREEVSVTFQGVKSGGKIERMFEKDGIDETAIDTCELYTQEGSKSINSKIDVEKCEDMGRIDSAVNFVESIIGVSDPINTPEQGLMLMKVVDAIYKSSETNQAIKIE